MKAQREQRCSQDMQKRRPCRVMSGAEPRHLCIDVKQVSSDAKNKLQASHGGLSTPISSCDFDDNIQRRSDRVALEVSEQIIANYIFVSIDIFPFTVSMIILLLLILLILHGESGYLNLFGYLKSVCFTAIKITFCYARYLHYSHTLIAIITPIITDVTVTHNNPACPGNRARDP